MMPMGPAPVISTSSPRTGKLSAVWTALPNGSKMAATSRSMDGSWCQTFVIARPVDADSLGVGAQMPPAGQAVATAATNHVPFAADDFTRMKVNHVRADRY